jgi:hypothetical protein
MSLPNLKVDQIKQNSDVSWLWLWLAAGTLTTPLFLFLVGRWHLTPPSNTTVKPDPATVGTTKNSIPQLDDMSRAHRSHYYKELGNTIPHSSKAELVKLVDSGVLPASLRQPEFTASAAFDNVELTETLSHPLLVNGPTLIGHITKFVVAQQKTIVQPKTTTQKQIAQGESGRIFLFVNQTNVNPQPIQASLIQSQKAVADILRSRGFTVLEVPMGTPSEAIRWINPRSRPGDIALSIQTDAFINPDARGTSAFYTTGSKERQWQAERLLRQLKEAVPEVENRGAKPDSETALGRLTFTQDAKVPAIVLTVGFSTNPKERSLMVNRIQDLAQGIANGLETWSRSVSPAANRALPRVNINIKGRPSKQQGIVVDGMAYVPAETVKQLRIPQPEIDQQLCSGNKLYIRVSDLQEAGADVNWNPQKRTVAIRPALMTDADMIDKTKIMGRGALTQTQLESFLRTENPQALKRFSTIAKMYLEEAAAEGVNADVAFIQALLETNFFRFDRGVSVLQNNFAGLRSIGSPSAATFASARIGVRAHIQQLKAYANQEALTQPIVSPRFRFVQRGSAPTVKALSTRWSTDPQYGDKILAILSRLYSLSSVYENLQ